MLPFLFCKRQLMILKKRTKQNNVVIQSISGSILFIKKLINIGLNYQFPIL
jgi:hypothetical protein